MTLSANGFQNASLTFRSTSDLTPGIPVKMSANFTVAACAEDDAPCGVLLSCRDKLCSVCLKGAVTLPYSGTAPSVGAATILADGDGGVVSDETGTPVLIVAVDTTASTVTFIL